MEQPITQNHCLDDDGNPAGGTTDAVGLQIQWQNGPLGRGEERKAPNGAFVETVIRAALDRIQFYQAGRFNCVENGDAVVHLQLALKELNRRTQRREDQETEGTHEGV